jgi:hypothetical protein
LRIRSGLERPDPFDLDDHVPAAMGNEDVEGTLQRGRARERPINASV